MFNKTPKEPPPNEMTLLKMAVCKKVQDDRLEELKKILVSAEKDLSMCIYDENHNMDHALETIQLKIERALEWVNDRIIERLTMP